MPNSTIPLDNGRPRSALPNEMRNPVNPTHPRSPAAVSDYIADLCGELVEMAGRAGLSDLAYLLDVARLEADIARRRQPKP